MSEEKSLVKSIFGYSISSWVNIILGFAYTFLSTRMLRPEVYGTVSIFINSSNTLMYIISLGFDASLIRFFNETPNGESQKSFSSKLIGLVSIHIVLLFSVNRLFFFETFSNFVFERVSWLLTVLLFVAAYCLLLLRFFNIFYRMSFDVKRYTIQNILMQSSAKILTIIAALFKPEYETIIIFQVMGIMIITILYSTLQRKEVFSLKNIEPRKDMYRGYVPVVKFALFSAPLYVSTTLNTLLAQGVIRKILGTETLGVYASVSIFGSLLTGISTGFSTFWAAYVYKNYETEKKKICQMTDYVLIGVIVLIAGFVLFKDILYIFIGREYYNGIYFFSILLVIYSMDLLSQATFYGISIVKKNHITAITNCIFVVVNTILTYVGAINWGIRGTAYCMLLSKMILFFLNTVIAQHYYRTIEHPIKFIVGFFMIIIIGILPSLHLSIITITIIVGVILFVTEFVFKEQCKSGFEMVIKFCAELNHNKKR